MGLRTLIIRLIKSRGAASVKPIAMAIAGISLLIILSAVYFYHVRKLQIQKNINLELAAIADLKAEQIIQWRKERLADAMVLGNAADFRDLLCRVDTANLADIIKMHDTPMLSLLTDSKKYRSVTIYSIDKSVIVSTATDKKTIDNTDEQAVFDSVIAGGIAKMTDLHSATHDYRNIYSILYAPIKHSITGKVHGILALEIDPNDFLFPLIQSWPMPSRSAEVLLVRRDGDSIVYLNELRYKKHTALSMRLPLTRKDLPAAFAVSGFTGTIEGVDYRGVPVLFSSRGIPETGWFIITKVDAEEAYVVLRQLYCQSLVVVCLLILLIIAFGIIYQRHQSSEVYKRLYAAEVDKNTLAASLKESEFRFGALFKSMTEGVAIHDVLFDDNGKPVDYRILNVNGAYEKHTGISQEKTHNVTASGLYGTAVPPYLREYSQVVLTGQPYIFETFFPPMNKYFAISVCSLGNNQFATVFEDITRKKLIDTERENTIQLLSLLNAKNSLVDLMKAVTLFLKTWSGCEAIGIRLKNGDDYPYFETRGFPAAFIELESSLCAIDEIGNPVFDDIGNPVIECMCGNVICGRFDPSKPFFTRKGSFWSNCTTDLLASTTESDRQSRTRNRCNGEGYESVALVRLKFADRAIGLIQVNDHGKNRFSIEFIEQLERFADSIAIALEQRQNQADLALEKERLLVTFRSIGDGVITTDTNGRITLMNTIAEQLTGYTSTEARGKPLCDVFNIVNESTRVKCENPVDKVLTTGSIIGLANHTALISKDGSERAIADSGAPIRNSKGEILGVVLVFRDVSEKNRAEAYIRESDERFRKVYEEGNFGIVFVNKAFQFERVNRAFCTMLGYSEEELVQKTFKEITHPDCVNGDVENVKLLMQGAIQVYKNDKRYIKKDGSTLWASVAVTAIRNASGELLYFVTMIEDISHRKEAEELLVLEKERLSVTLRSIGDAVIATDTTGSITLMNRVAETLTGWTQENACGKRLTDVFSIVDKYTREQRENPVERVLQNRSITLLKEDTLLLSKDGREMLIGDSGAPIFDRNGIILGVVLVFRDITEKQRTEAAAQKTEKLESLGILAAGIAHDFNNLLSGLYGYLDLTRECVAADSDAIEYINKAFSVFGRTKDLTSQLLTFAKGGAPARKTKHLPPLIRDTVQFALSGSAIKCNFDVDEQLWPCDVDENQLSQVIDNMIINARDAMPRGGTIDVTAENILHGQSLPATLVRGSYIRVIIKDQGTGISPANLPYIFDPFFTTKQKGSGLGLAVSFSIIQRHNGTIEVESILGQGTTFFIYLPVSDGNMVEDTAHQTEKHFGAGTVLVMDDEDYIREVASEMLSAMGYTTITAETGEMAIDELDKAVQSGKKIVFALLDLTVPGGMGGLEASAVIKKIDPDIKIIASSGYSDDPVIAHPEQHGFDGSIRKPYYKMQLEQIIMTVMKKESAVV